MDNLKVLIVDDEYLIRNLLRMRIDWEQQGMTIIGEASSAHEALALVDQSRPDIIFTDIYMPSVNGIELSGMILEKYPDIKIVVVTGHDEFEYARESVKLGISEFILKPIRSSELLQVTDKLRRKILEERTRDRELEKLKEDLERNRPFLKEKFLNQWVTGVLSYEEILEKAEYFKIPIHASFACQIAVIEITSASEKQSEEQMLLMEMECKNKADAFFQNDSEVLILSDTRNRIVIIAMERDADFICKCERFQSVLLDSYPCFVNIGIGRRHEDPQDMHLGYREARRALQFKTFVGKNQVISLEDVVDNRERPYCSNRDLLEQLRFNVGAGSSDCALRILREILDVPFSNTSQLRMAAMDVITECQHAGIEQEIENERVFHKETLISILTADNLPELKGILEGYVARLTEAIYSKYEAKEGSLISRVKDYLEQHMGDPELGLTSTAAAFFISPGHLGRLMKKETGQTFVEYLTNLRMKRAEALLRKTDLRGYEVGEKVGIPNPHYFSVLFKKSIGRSVNEYRNSR